MLPLKNISHLSKAKIKFIKSLHVKKYRLQENTFLLEGEKNVSLLLASSYEITMLVATSSFLQLHADLLYKRQMEIFQVDAKTLSNIGTLKTNNAALAVVRIPANQPFTIGKQKYALVLDNLTNPGNLGTIIRVAGWYGIKHIVCSTHTVELYNPKVLQASMGSFLHVQVYYTDLVTYLAHSTLPIMGAFIEGESLHDPNNEWPTEGLIVIGNEAKGISSSLLPYIQRKISIPKYGQAQSLNAALATAIICDNLVRMRSHRK